MSTGLPVTQVMGAANTVMPSRCSESASVSVSGKKNGAVQTPLNPNGMRLAPHARMKVLSSGSPRSPGSASVTLRISGKVNAAVIADSASVTRVSS